MVHQTVRYSKDHHQRSSVMLVTMFAKGDMENIPVAKLKEIRRALEI